MRYFLLISCLLFCCTSFSQEKARLLDSVYTSLFQQKKFNGNVLIAEKGVPVFIKSYGIADENSGRLLNENTVFELASVSKQFTAFAVFLLEKKGKLGFEDRISKYFPELSFYGDITVSNLIFHSSGLPDYMDLMDSTYDKSRIAVNDDIVRELAKHKPARLFEPGSKFNYSNTGYALLGSIIEKVSGKSFGEYLRENIFKPFGMTSTRVYRSRYQPEVIPNYALGYLVDRSGKKLLPDSLGRNYYTYYLDGIVGDGMVNSTLADLLKWDRALYTSPSLTEEDRNKLFNAGSPKVGNGPGYGFGWFISDSSRYGKYINHSGSWAGYLTYIERHIDHDKTIIVLQNNTSRKSAIPVDESRKILYNEKLEMERLLPVNLAPGELEKYSGVYGNEDFPVKLKVYHHKDSLWMVPLNTSQSPYSFESFANHIFLNKNEEVRLEFDPEKKLVLLKFGSRTPVLLRKE